MARHDEVRDLIADIMQEVVHDVETEPQLQPYEEEDLAEKTTHHSTEARVYIGAHGFSTRQQDAFFDIRVTHLKANLLFRSEALRQLECHEREKKR